MSRKNKSARRVSVRTEEDTAQTYKDPAYHGRINLMSDHVVWRYSDEWTQRVSYFDARPDGVYVYDDEEPAA